MKDLFGVVGALVVFFVVLAIVGFANIWALNTLFPSLNIPYTIETWFASIVIFGSITHYKNRKDD